MSYYNGFNNNGYYIYNILARKPFREEMNCQRKSLSIQAILRSVPTGSGESADKPVKKGLRWSKASGLEMMGAPSMKQEPQILQG